MSDKLTRLKKLINEVYDIEYASAVLCWDQETYMPPGAIEDRSLQISTLSKIGHEKFTNDEVGALLDDLEGYSDGDNDDDACLIKVLKRNYDKQVRVPKELVEEFAKITALGQHAWQKAREQSDFSIFQPHLEKIVENRKKYAEIFKPHDHIYDALLDDFEPKLKTADVRKIFDKLRPKQVELIQMVSEHEQIDNRFLKQNFDIQKQWDFGVKVITDFGYDWNHGRQDKVAHPFTTTLGLGDVRITTRIMEDDLFSGLSSTMHEGGHAIYEQGIDRKFNRTPIGSGASLAIHESQSRLWENLVGRSYAFCEHYFPKLKALFPDQLKDVDTDMFYRGINKIEPSLIRVEADEATYNLHIMLRLEIELGIFENKIEVKDLPEIWNTKMSEYLGLTPQNDQEGVLQDVHWSHGLFGYFSTYALGNLISAQLWEKIDQELDDLESQIRQGKFRELREWLRQNLHIHGAKYEPQTLVERLTGSKIDPDPYINYLNTKIKSVYR